MNYELSSLVVAETTTQSPRSPLSRQSPRSPFTRQSPRSPLSPKSSKALKSSIRGSKKGSVNFGRGPRFSSFANSSSIDSPTVAFDSSVNPDSPRRREFLMSGSVTFANSARIGSGDWGEEATEIVRFTEGGRQVDPLTQAELKRRRRSSLWAGGSSSANPMIEQLLNDQANNSTKHDPTELKRRRMSSNAGRRISTAATAVEQDDLPLPQASTNKEAEFSAFPVPTTLLAGDGLEATEELNSGAAQDAERAKRLMAKANMVHSFSDSSESGNVNFPHLADFRNCTSQAQHQAQLQESKLLEEKVNKMIQDEIRYRPFDISREIDDAIEIKGRVLQERARLLQARKK